ncbi:MAG: FKBP-type peptidyl-prolyl cis-trans isomerase [Ignavibacteria bacterium]|nr:FKBP-type peptidyl-prolyl cis-trans isomerase [Ignavibacteria bacterium]
MKLILMAVVILAALYPRSARAQDVALYDTVQTSSGLKYFYVKKGIGRKVEKGSEVSTCLSLMVKGKVVWTSFGEKDSVITFVAGSDPMIKGFMEMTMLMREGDEVVAILPDSLGYGAQESGDGAIPPFATLVYNKFRMVKVSEPKCLLSDTLLAIIEKQDIAAMIETYQRITSSSDSLKYVRGVAQMNALWDALTRKGMYQQALDVISFYAKVDNGWQWRGLSVPTFERMGQLERALDTLKVLIHDFPNEPFLINYEKGLLERMSKPSEGKH